MEKTVCGVILFAGLLRVASAQYSGWQHSGSIYLLTTPEGANLPATASEEGFPLLVRLHQDFFDFSQAKANGEDIRFSTRTGTPLACQIEEWDAASGTASIWVRLPTIKGNARQEIRLHWGKPGAASESNGKAVFNESNGYLSVWHMGEAVPDEVGTLESQDVGTTATPGMVGKARHFAGRQAVFCGDKIANYPSGASPHSSEAWFRPEKPNCTILAWGNEQAQGKVVMQFRSPPHVTLDCYFSDGNVKGGSTLPMSHWTHAVHTYEKGDARVYVNGLLDGASKSTGAPLSIKSPARMWIGGWYNDYDFIGDIDEVRISKVVRSADWMQRVPAKDEKPEDGQFYSRDDQNEGTLYYNGSRAEAADLVFLKLYADDQLIKTESAKPAADKSYALAVKLQPGLIKYKVEFGTKAGGQETVRHTATNIVCGDAYLIDGQSNALATDTSEKSPPETNEWIRSYGRPPGNRKDAPGNLWCHPVWKAQNGEKAELGWWGMELAKRLLESQKVPIFIINAAVGGTRIDQHQRNAADPADLTTLYGRMLWRDTIALEFDLPVVWADALAGQFYLDGEKDKVASGSVTGNVLTLKLKTASVAKKITYLKEIAWSQDTLLHGANNLAALTFCNVPLADTNPPR